MSRRPPGATRRTGATLERAIHAAVLDELSETGYAGLALDRVAKRAGIGRASLYRRWSTKADLVADAIAGALPAVEAAPDTGHVRSDRNASD